MATQTAYNHQVDVFRDAEYPMMHDKVYLDHGGTTIYAKSLIEEFSAKMINNLFGNPHSASAPAMLSGHMCDEIRLQALAFFNADPEHFDLVFVQNATAAIKLVGEAFCDLSDSSSAGSFWYGYHKDAHTSIVGVRELTKGTHHCFANDDEVEDWLNDSKAAREVIKVEALPCLFAYPGQSNMTGRRLPLNWAKKLRQSTAPLHQNAYTLLDAAALATATEIDLSDPESAPDFVALSFYKIFGFPDLGALIIRKESGHILSWRKYFGGGTINALTVIGEPTKQRKTTSLHDNLEDGTLPFHSIIALGCAIDVHKRLYGSMKKISQHTSYLAYRLYHGMASLVHYNGQPLCAIYNDVSEGRCTYGDPITQGGTLAFNLVRSNGKFIGHSFVEKQANDRGIFLRSGGLCNSGGITSYLKIESWQFMRAWSQGHRCGEAGLDNINGKPTGVVRVSLGAMTTMKDIDTFLAFLESEYVETERVLQLARFDDLNVHWGLETTISHDSGVGSTTEVSRRQNVAPHPQLRTMTSSPNISTMRAAPAVVLTRAFYEQRPGTATSTVDLPRAPTMSQRRPDTARHLVPLDSMRHYNDFDGPMGISPTTQLFIMNPVTNLGTTSGNTKQKGGFMKFLRGRKSSQLKET
ncbi:related to hxB protein [Phialocephala subalpina]|uniref:Related to hxB protein n=1 Tax=Phialocephala subalpina TaxID=576137 RepID=A0A1L7WDK6_9HELO|nr:related to hxB protein [Phialocephala subalpina]